jgi:transposase
MMSEVQNRTQRIDHLGIVAGICKQIDLIGQIDRQVGDVGRKVSVGQAIQAMVLNGLGFVNRPLYLTPEFYANKPVEWLIGPGIGSQDLNDDCLGRALDWVVQVGVTEIYYHLAAHALSVMGIVNRFAHVDTSAFSVEGAYELEEEDAIKITYGYSKDHRPDLKQAMLGLICANAQSIPVWLEALDGNRADKKGLVSMATAYIGHCSAEQETPYIIADSAWYGADNLKALSSVKWVTRVPATLSTAQKLLASISRNDMTAGPDGYFYYEQTVSYGGVEQRWLLVLSEKSRERELRQFERTIAKERTQAKSALKILAREHFACETDALSASERVQKGLKYHRLTPKAKSSTHYAKRGRPTADEVPSLSWKLQASLELDEDRVSASREPLGKYIVATNELEREKLPTLELLSVYKDQNRSVERGFRFLKDPWFFASSFFLKKPSRIMGLLMVMGISLLVYSLAEHLLRSQLAAQEQTIPDQLGKPTKTPTMRRVFQMFDGMDLFITQRGDMRFTQVLNLQPIHHQILALLGPTVQQFYNSLSYCHSWVT